MYLNGSNVIQSLFCTFYFVNYIFAFPVLGIYKSIKEKMDELETKALRLIPREAFTSVWRWKINNSIGFLSVVSPGIGRTLNSLH